MAFLFVFFFWDSCDSNVWALNIVPEVSEVVLISFHSFFLFSSLLNLFPPFYLPPHFIFCLSYSMLVPSRVLLISVIALFIIDWLFFISSTPLVNFSGIFSIFVSRLFICNSILFSRFWVIFTIIILNSFTGRLPISSFCLVWWAFIVFLYLLNISLPFHLV